MVVVFMSVSSECSGRSWGDREGWWEGGMPLLQLQTDSGIQLNGGKLAVNKSRLEKRRRMHTRSEAIGKSSDGSRKKPPKNPTHV